MQSSGGTLTPETAERRPAHLIESGPAAGVMACSYLGRLTGRRQLISLDMGGTTAKAAIVEDGLPVRTSEYEVGAGINLSSKLVKGGGHPIKLPFIDVSEIGAGGGSIVSIDPLGSVSVGPRSAGSVPGPACYGIGGDEPTLTDALLVLGYLGAAQLGGGAITLDPERARAALDRVVATPLGRVRRGGGARHPAARRRDDDARGEGGHDVPRPRPARLHALRVRGQRAADRRRGRARARDAPRARPSRTRRLQRPRAALLGHRARGRAHADAAGRRDHSPSASGRRSGSSRPRRERTSTGDGDAPVTVSRYADVRFAGQAYELPVPVPAGEVDVARLVADFVAEHVRTYGHGSARRPGRRRLRPRARPPRAHGGAALRPTRGDPGDARRSEGSTAGLLRPRDGPRRDPRLQPRRAPRRGRRSGPLLVDEPDSTCVVPPGWVALLDDHGNIEVETRCLTSTRSRSRS